MHLWQHVTPVSRPQALELNWINLNKVWCAAYRALEGEQLRAWAEDCLIERRDAWAQWCYATFLCNKHHRWTKACDSFWSLATIANVLRPSPEAFREREMEPVLRSLAGLDSRAAAAAAAINTITAFSGRFSGPVFFWGVISLSSFLVLNRYVSKQIHIHTHEQQTSRYCNIRTHEQHMGIQQYTWIYEYISMNIACIHYGIFTQLCQTTLAFTNT